MPPPNAARRAALTDAALHVLAAHGQKGLTHRAVDAAAGVPVGTSSRYYPSRDALLAGIVERVSAQHLAAITAVTPTGSLTEDELEERIAGLVQDSLGPRRSQHLVMANLLLEGTRDAALQAVLTNATSAMIPVLRDLLRATGRTPDDTDIAHLVTALSGLVYVLLTHPPAALGLADGALDGFVRDAVRTQLARC